MLAVFSETFDCVDCCCVDDKFLYGRYSLHLLAACCRWSRCQNFN